MIYIDLPILLKSTLFDSKGLVLSILLIASINKKERTSYYQDSFSRIVMQFVKQRQFWSTLSDFN